MNYDYLIVGSGLFGSIFAYEANKKGKKCLVIDKRPHIGGNIYTENIDGINVHKYGAHIFHTSNKEVWDYIQQFAEFNRYTNSPVARYKDELYNLPFNLNTFSRMFNLITPQDIEKKLDEERKEGLEKLNGKEPSNLEEQAISLVGTTVYEKLIKGYTEKQWGMPCTELPSFIIKRLPVRMIYDNNYFNDKYQGIPIGGYTQIIEKMLDGIDVKLNYDFFEHREKLENIADKIVFTGQIDKYYDYKFGQLEYRSVRFETEKLDIDNYQGNAVVNYTDREVPYTRIIEHKHFEQGKQLGNEVTEGPSVGKTIISKEYSDKWDASKEPYYPINNERNNELYAKYENLAKEDNKVIFGGRLGQYKYYDMDKVIVEALKCVSEELK
jgi:UDP-galactopyranose mutase